MGSNYRSSMDQKGDAENAFPSNWTHDPINGLGTTWEIHEEGGRNKSIECDDITNDPCGQYDGIYSSSFSAKMSGWFAIAIKIKTDYNQLSTLRIYLENAANNTIGWLKLGADSIIGTIYFATREEGGAFTTHISGLSDNTWYCIYGEWIINASTGISNWTWKIGLYSAGIYTNTYSSIAGYTDPTKLGITKIRFTNGYYNRDKFRYFDSITIDDVVNNDSNKGYKSDKNNPFLVEKHHKVNGITTHKLNNGLNKWDIVKKNGIVGNAY